MSIELLSYDEIYNISNFLNFNDILNFSIISKCFFYLFDNIFYINYANKIFGKEFWKLARSRPKKLSNPLNNMKSELLRIENFQNFLDKLYIKRWKNEDFYLYWELQIKCNKIHYN